MRRSDVYRSLTTKFINTLRSPNSRDLATVFHALAKSGVYNQRALTALLDYATSHAADLEPRGIATVLWGAATCGIVEHAAFRELLRQFALRVRGGAPASDRAVDSANVLWAIAATASAKPQGVVDTESVRFILRAELASDGAARGCGPVEVATLMSSAVKLGVLDRDIA